MAKRNLGNLEENNKNLGGVGALFNSGQGSNPAKEKEPENEDDKETSYPLRMKKSSLKSLKVMAANQEISMRDLIMNALNEKYGIEK